MKRTTIHKHTPKIIKKSLRRNGMASSYGYSNLNHSKKPLLVEAESSDGTRNKVPKGFLAVYVGPQRQRFVIPVSFLATPEFRVLMENVAEEFGCDHHGGGALEIPCDEDHFEQILISCLVRQRSHKLPIGNVHVPH